MIVNLLPTGLVGLMIAALLAALMGAMSSVFNSASTMVTLDFYKKFRPAATEKQLCLFRARSTAAMGPFGLLWVPYIKYLTHSFSIYLQSVQAYISTPTSAVCFNFRDYFGRAERHTTIGPKGPWRPWHRARKDKLLFRGGRPELLVEIERYHRGRGIED